MKQKVLYYLKLAVLLALGILIGQWLFITFNTIKFYSNDKARTQIPKAPEYYDKEGNRLREWR